MFFEDKKKPRIVEAGLLLKDIPSLEKIVLFDTSVNHSDMPKGIYDFKRYHKIPAEYLETAERSMEQTIAFVQNPKCFTVPEVIEEWKVFLEKISEKLEYHNEKLRFDIKRHIKESTLEKSQQTRDQFERISLKLFHLINIAKKSFYKPANREAYEGVFTSTVAISKAFNLKSPKPNEYIDSRADESLVALGLYLSLFENKPSIIVTNDGDFGRILLKMAELIRSAPSSEAVKSISQRLDTTPMQIWKGASMRNSYFLEASTEGTTASVIETAENAVLEGIVRPFSETYLSR